MDFPTFARTRPPDTQISKSVLAVLRHFNWTQVTKLIYQMRYELIYLYYDYMVIIIFYGDIHVLKEFLHEK